MNRKYGKVILFAIVSIIWFFLAVRKTSSFDGDVFGTVMFYVIAVLNAILAIIHLKNELKRKKSWTIVLRRMTWSTKHISSVFYFLCKMYLRGWTKGRLLRSPSYKDKVEKCKYRGGPFVRKRRNRPFFSIHINTILLNVVNIMHIWSLHKYGLTPNI